MTLILNEIREQIDSIDNHIHDLIMRRASLVSEIGKEKAKKNLPVIHPARETDLVRRLLKRHHGNFPPMALVGMWRELIGALCMMQTDVSVSVADHEHFESTWADAKTFYGSVIKMTKTQSDLMAVASLRNKEATFSVVPWPKDGVDDSHQKSWWEHAFILGQGDVYIIGALPFVYDSKTTVSGFGSLEKKAMVLSREPFQPSETDHTCFVLRIDHSVSRGRIIEVFESGGLTPISLHTKTDAHFENTSLHMIIAKGYHIDNHDFIASVQTAFDGFEMIFKPVGGYAVPHGVN